jgi:lipopolysaccharide transport system ATP-binding protein
MTGRENIYMNGAIMGMTKQEITRKLDEIVDFSGCERYIDTPTKRYSSGMTVRLGFAIAAHLEPEILVVDEVLAVGDAEFQKKAIGKMQDVSKGGGRTVLFVSHNMAAVKSLCKRGVILQNGMLVDSGDVDTIVSHYLKGDEDIENHKVWSIPEVKKEGFELLEIGVRRVDGDYADVMRVDHDIEMIIRYRLKEPYPQFHLTFHFKNEQGYKIFSTSGGGLCIPYEHKEGEYLQVCKIPANFLNWGNYMVDMYAVKDRSKGVVVENDVISFTLANKQSALGSWMGREPGDVRPQFDYTEEKIG